MTVEYLIATYGYLAIAIGTFFEGETIVVLGGFAAHQGYLSFPFVLLNAFLGTFLGDQLYFYIGRVKGKSILTHRPRWKSKSEKIISLFHKHHIALILGFRFVYGIRTITPFILGWMRIAPARFLVLNFLGAGAWAIGIGALGYAFGYHFSLLLSNIKQYEAWCFVGLLATGAIIWLVRLAR